MNVREESNFKAQANPENDFREQDVRIKANHLIKGNDYAIAKVHVMIEGEGNVSEDVNFNAGVSDGEIKRNLAVQYKQSLDGGMEVMGVNKNNNNGLGKGIPVHNQPELPKLLNSKSTSESDTLKTISSIGDGVTFPHNPPGDHDYIIVVKGDVKVTKHAKDLMPYDVIFGNALQGKESYSYGVWLKYGNSLVNAKANSGNLNYNYSVNPEEELGEEWSDYCVWNGTDWVGYCWNGTGWEECDGCWW